METGLCEGIEAGPIATAIAKRTPAVPVAVILRERGEFPPALDANGRPVDVSPLARLSPAQRRRRLVGILELLAMHGDGAAAKAALEHARWEQEMRTGKAPQRVDLNAVGEIKVIDTLSAPAGTPIPLRPGPRRAIKAG